MIGDAYASLPEFRASEDISSFDDDLQLGWALAAVSRVLDRKLNQPLGFNKDDAVTTRVYKVGDPIAPIASISGLIVKVSFALAPPIIWADIDPLTLDTDFELLPLVPAAGCPWTEINVFNWWRFSEWNWDHQPYMPKHYRIQVTAIHGWPAVPVAIKLATIKLTSMLLGLSPFASNRIDDAGTLLDVAPQARSLLKSLHQVYNPFPVAVA